MIPNRYFARFSRHQNSRYFGVMRMLKLCVMGVEGGELPPPPSTEFKQPGHSIEGRAKDCALL